MTDISNDSSHPEVAALRKRTKLLTIAVSALFIIEVIRVASNLGGHPHDGSGWPDLNANELRVKTFLLSDDKGNTTAIFGMLGNAPGLMLLDSKGKTRALLTISNDKGLLTLGSDGQEESTNLTNGALRIGDAKVGGVTITGPPLGGPYVSVYDDAGYIGKLGRSATIDPQTGATQLNSAATLTGSSKALVSTTPLIRQTISPANQPLTQVPR
jgi:hypothetical protein